MTDQEDELIDDLFADESENTKGESPEVAVPWKIMIVDDEPAVHEVTKLALNGVRFDNRPLEFVSCYSGAEAREAIAAHADTAMILLDVVMETEHAGLDFAQYVRRDAANTMARIVLRTGQPGQAPERQVIVDYDINDYKEKTELTASKLFTLTYSSLRAYRDILAIETSKRGLGKVIEASTDIFKLSSLERFAEGVLEQIGGLISSQPGTLFLKSASKPAGLAACYDSKGWRSIAGTGRYREISQIDIEEMTEKKYKGLLEEAIRTGKLAYNGNAIVGFFEDRSGNKNLLLVDGFSKLGEIELNLIEMYARNVSIAFENIHLHEDLEQTQRETIYLLGEAVETRSEETGGHVKRVAELSHFLCRAAGGTEEEADLLRAASPLHDVGKIGIPDAILHKPGPLDQDEWATMKTHAEIGYKLLAPSRRKILAAAASIAYEHHENWDGTGYPQGKKGTDIHPFARITAVADTFDALQNKRSYKEAWPREEALDFVMSQAGLKFDPDICELLKANLDEIDALLANFRAN